MGVAESVSTSTFVQICFSFHMCYAKRCSSSTISQAPVTNSTSFDSSLPARVPTIMSTSPRLSPHGASACCLGVRKRDNISTFTGNPRAHAKRDLNRCWRARIDIVGTSIATCFAGATAANADRKNNSILPKPTSPHTAAGPSVGAFPYRALFLPMASRARPSVSSYSNSASNHLVLHLRHREESRPACSAARRKGLSAPRAISLTAAFTRAIFARPFTHFHLRQFDCAVLSAAE